VEAALLFNDKKFPPLLPRKLRVSRAKKMRKAAAAAAPAAKSAAVPPASRKLGDNGAELGPVYVSKASASMKTLHGRADKLLGRGAAARLKANSNGAKAATRTRRDGGGSHGAPMADVAPEGHRATKQDGQTKHKRRASGGKKTRHGRQRSAAWKAAGGASRKK
jgi:nucleolar protein 12